MYRRSLIRSATAAGLLAAPMGHAVRAQSFPSKQLRVLVGFAAGGGGDIVARVLLAVLAMEQWRDQLPAWLQRLAERPSWLWNTGIGLIIGLSLLRWLLQR